MEVFEELEGHIKAAHDALITVDHLIRDFITQVEGCGFTDHLGHRMEMNTAYQALKASVNG